FYSTPPLDSAGQIPRRYDMTEKSSTPWRVLQTVVGVIYVFMLGPILITAAVSFNAGNRSLFPPQGFSLRWWSAALSPEWIEPLSFSLRLAIITSVVSTLLSLPLAFAIVRHKFRGRGAIEALTVGPLMVPSLVTGVGLLQFFEYLGWRAYIGFPALLAGHVAISMPFAVRTIAVSLHTLPSNLERAAQSLGASGAAVMRHIILPLIKNGIVAGMVFAFIHS